MHTLIVKSSLVYCHGVFSYRDNNLQLIFAYNFIFRKSFIMDLNSFFFENRKPVLIPVLMGTSITIFERPIASAIFR